MARTARSEVFDPLEIAIAHVIQRCVRRCFLMGDVGNNYDHRKAMANREEEQLGRFWQGRFRAVRICDEAAMLACAAYVDLNPIRAALAETLEGSDYTSVQRRIESLPCNATATRPSRDEFLAPVEIDQSGDAIGAVASSCAYRASDKGFLPMSEIEYIRLLDWTARVFMPGKPGATPADAPEVLERLGLKVPQWSGLVRDFGRLFSLAAGLPGTLAQQRTRLTHRRWHTRSGLRQLFESKAA